LPTVVVRQARFGASAPKFCATRRAASDDCSRIPIAGERSVSVRDDDDAFPAWQGDLFVGNLAGEHLARFSVDGREVAEVGPVLAERGWRIRDVAVAPDTGHLFVAVDAGNAPVVRLVPA